MDPLFARVHRSLVAGPLVGAATVLFVSACGVPREPEPLQKIADDPIQIVEIMSKNDGAWIDLQGETDDWIELHNSSDSAISLRGYSLADGSGTAHALPDLWIEPGDVRVLWPDDDPEQGLDHLEFKLSSEGERVTLRSPDGALIQLIDVPPLEPNQAWVRLQGTKSFSACAWASPGRVNGEFCGPPPPPTLEDDIEFEQFDWPSPWPTPPPIAINELGLSFADSDGFIELVNNGSESVDLSMHRLEVAATDPSQPWPDSAQGLGFPTVLPLPDAPIDPGAHLVVDLDDGALAALADSNAHEGVVTLFDPAGDWVDRVDFRHWPEGAALARQPSASGYAVFCQDWTPGDANHDCSPLPSRALDDYVRHLRTPGDFSALASGGQELGVESVKLVHDLDLGDQVYFLDSSKWDLHFTFTRQVIDQLDPLDLCDPDDAAQFQLEWSAFSNVNYGDGPRRYILTTASRHGGSQLQTLDYFMTDEIDAQLIGEGFFAAMKHLGSPSSWSWHVKTSQIERALALEGQMPMVGPNAPYAELEYQPLNQVVGYGVLAFVPAQDIFTTDLGPQTIVVTDLVPNDIPFVGGLITESFQTPLSHVNVLSKNRGSPNMALADARHDPDIAALFGELVRLEVGPAEFTIEPADPEEAAEFWQQQSDTGPPQVPELDTDVRGVVSLDQAAASDVPSIGAKAAQLAELATIEFAPGDDITQCRYREHAGAASEPTGVTVLTPPAPFAIPVVHSLEHFHASGAANRLDELRNDPAFVGDPIARAQGLAHVRELIMAHPVDAQLLAEVEQTISARFGDARVRFRSSSNTEDLEGFSGAGLYTSQSGALGDPERPIDDAIRTVWASLWNARAWDEREFYNVSQDDVAMAILCHPAFLSEKANGVAVSRDILDPDDDNSDYLNVQFGEATVTNPAPGIAADQFVHHWWGDVYISRSSFAELFDDSPVLTPKEIKAVDCALDDIQAHYTELFDPDAENDWFAMEIEFKLTGEARNLMIKQARPYSFGRVEVPNECPEE